VYQFPHLYCGLISAIFSEQHVSICNGEENIL
jgi:hypothetical protein